jgi:LysR family glycine cleavage system transcriptional activator
MKLPPLNALRAFEASARRGSFALAATELGVTSAAVSLQVRKLEEFFGKTLFTRAHNHISLTDAGMAVYSESAGAFEQLTSMTGRILGQPVLRSLCISVLPSLAERWMAPRLAPLLNELAGGGLRIRVEDDPVDISRDGVDLRITYGAHFYPGASSAVLYQEHMAAVISPLHAAAGESPDSLAERQFIHVEWGPQYHDHLGWNDWFAAIGLPRNIVPANGTQLANASLALAFAESGGGAALVHASLTESAIKAGRLQLLHPKQLALPRPYCAIYREQSLEQSDFVRLLKALSQPSRASTG